MKTRLFMFPGQGSQLVGMGKDFLRKARKPERFLSWLTIYLASVYHSFVLAGRKMI